MQEIFVSLGFSDVSVFKQSGNVVFETAIEDAGATEKKAEDGFSKIFGLEVCVFVRELSELKRIVDGSPFGDVGDEGASYWVTFMSEVPSVVTVPFRIPGTEAEVVLIRGREAYSVTHGHGEGGRPNPFLESRFKVEATTRNLNVLREIVSAYGR